MCDEVVGGDLLVQLVVGALVTPHQVVQLVPGLSLGPLLARMVLLDNFLAQGVGGQVLGDGLDAGNPLGIFLALELHTQSRIRWLIQLAVSQSWT